MRKTFTAASILSLMLCAATLVLWVRSYCVLDVSRIPASAKRVAWVWVSGNRRFGQAVAVKDSKTGKWIIGKPAEAMYYCRGRPPAPASGRVLILQGYRFRRRSAAEQPALRADGQKINFKSLTP